METEITALQSFIEARPIGNFMREIAERRLEDIHNRVHRVNDKPQRKPTLPVPCMDVISGRQFRTIVAASEWIGEKRENVTWDIGKGRFKYGIVPLSML